MRSQTWMVVALAAAMNAMPEPRHRERDKLPSSFAEQRKREAEAKRQRKAARRARFR